MANGDAVAPRVATLEVVYGAVSGGLLAVFTATTLYYVFVPDSETGMPSVAIAVIGLACAVGFMVLGMYLSERMSWIGTALLFASGFTALWCAAISFSTEQRWMTLVALGVATGLGIFMGWWRFGRVRPVPTEPGLSEPAPAAQTAAGDDVE
jgi:hypothetical protein